MNWQSRGSGSGFDLVRKGEVLARVRWDGKERWYAVAQHGDLVLNTQRYPLKTADGAKGVAERWLRARGVT